MDEFKVFLVLCSWQQVFLLLILAPLSLSLSYSSSFSLLLLLFFLLFDGVVSIQYLYIVKVREREEERESEQKIEVVSCSPWSGALSLVGTQLGEGAAGAASQPAVMVYSRRPTMTTWDFFFSFYTPQVV